VLLGRSLVQTGAAEKAARVLAAAQLRAPNDMWLNVWLAHVLVWRVRPGRSAEAVGYCRAALAIRPKSPVLWVALGGGLSRVPGQADRAGEAYQRAVDSDPNYPNGGNVLGAHYLRRGDFAQAIPLIQRSLRLDPRYADAHRNLGLAYMNTCQWPEALEEV